MKFVKKFIGILRKIVIFLIIFFIIDQVDIGIDRYLLMIGKNFVIVSL